MPTQIRPPSAPVIDQTATADLHSISITPLTIIASLILALNLACSAALERSHAGSAIGPSSVGANVEIRRAVEAEPSLPYD